MRQALRLAHLLLRAVFYVGVIIVAAPLRMVLDALPHNQRGQRQMTDTNTNATTAEEVLSSYPPPRKGYSYGAIEGDLTDLREWAETAKTMLTELSVDASNARHALHSADVLSDIAKSPAFEDRTPQSISLADQVKWLIGNRDWHKQSHDAEWKAGRAAEARLQAALEAEARRASEAESKAHAYYERSVALAGQLEQANTTYQEQLSVLQRQLAELEEIRTKFMKQRDDALKDAAFFKEQAEVATAELRTEQALTRTLKALVVDADAQLEALQVEAAMLESHVDCIDEVCPDRADMWADWDLEIADEDAS